MKSNKMTIQINQPSAVVFEAATNPANTPKWIDSITEEKTSEWPAKLGTLYKNRGDSGEWGEFKITEFEQDKLFTLSDQGSAYHVRYTFTSTSKDGSTELEYYEWMDQGELDSPLQQSALQKLKQFIETGNT